jgi:replication factor C small subunit
MSSEMELIGESKLWVKKYDPKSFDDIIAPLALKTFLESIRKDGETTNLLFSGPAGTGKTATARAIAKELGTDYLYINASKDRSIDTIRYKVETYATTKSLFSDGLKIAILDEFDRLTPEAMDSLKALIEETETNCRYIFITNHIQKVIPPLISRCQQFFFGTDEASRKELLVQFFSRCRFILETEGVKYDKETLALFVKELFPDMRKIINELHKSAKAHGEIGPDILNTMDGALIKDLVSEMKGMKFDVVRSMVNGLDPASFYRSFYDDIKEYLQPESIPGMVVVLAEYAFRDGLSIDREINLVACLVELMKEVKWK